MLADEDQLTEAWTVWRRTGDLEAMEVLVRQYASLAGYLARRALAKAPPHQDREDILSYAHHGLLDALNKFDPLQGVKFETYATRRIAGAIIDGQRAQDPLTRSARRQVKLVEFSIEILWEKLDRDPTAQEIANEVGMSVEAVRESLQARKSLTSSLDAEPLEEANAHHGEAETVVQMREARGQMAMRLAGLDGRATAFVLAHYCDGLNMKETGQVLSIGPSWCRNARTQTLEALSRG